MAVQSPFYLVFFGTGQAILSSIGLTTVRQAAGVFKLTPTTTFAVIGHTDLAEVDVTTLSLRRANAVKHALIREGVPAVSISVVGKGSAQPLVLKTEVGVPEPQNRFAEIVPRIPR